MTGFEVGYNEKRTELHEKFEKWMTNSSIECYNNF